MKRSTIIQAAPGTLAVDATTLRYTRVGADVAEAYECRPAGPGAWWVRIGTRSFRVLAHGNQVSVNGRLLNTQVVDPRDRAASNARADQQGRAEIQSPMPGKVVRILVAVGDAVEPGQGLLVVEAMKMQNEMKSPKAGTVREIRTRTDATVQAGEVLVVIE
jgi:biotin carboxyl carrier protein